VGREVRGIAEGDLVAGRMPHASRGIMSTNSLFKVPPGVAVEQAAFIELGVITLQGIRKAGIRPGDRVAVVGQGLIGQMAVRLARIVGAGPIVAIASSRRRMSSALATGGADEFVAIADGPDALRAVQADVVIEAVGSSRAIAAAIETARPGGAVVLLGSARDLGRGLDWRTLAQERQIAVIGAHISAVPSRDASSGRWTYAQEGQLFLDLLASRRLDLTSLITWRPTPEECNTVYEVLAEGGREHVGIVFQWGQPGTGNMAGDLQAGRI
jgi:threonine dehydrogenase-like Zn-dependent dehydrogenase